jgi:hypothetical protein
MNDTTPRIYIVSATYVREIGRTTDISGFNFVTLARSEAEARGEAQIAGQQKFPDHRVAGPVTASFITDDLVRAAAQHMGMRQ